MKAKKRRVRRGHGDFDFPSDETLARIDRSEEARGETIVKKESITDYFVRLRQRPAK